VLPATMVSGLWVSGNLYFCLEARPPAHRLASVHFFSEISRVVYGVRVGDFILPRTLAPPSK